MQSSWLKSPTRFLDYTINWTSLPNPFISNLPKSKKTNSNDELDRLLGLLKDKDNQLKVLKQTKKVIVDLVTLLNFQWEVLVTKLGSITQQIKISRDMELAKVDEFLAILPTLDDSPLAMEIRKGYAFEKEQLILQQIELFGSEQQVLTQMEFVCNERDEMIKNQLLPLIFPSVFNSCFGKKDTWWINLSGIGFQENSIWKPL